jgi:hypothetical protein
MVVNRYPRSCAKTIFRNAYQSTRERKPEWWSASLEKEADLMADDQPSSILGTQDLCMRAESKSLSEDALSSSIIASGMSDRTMGLRGITVSSRGLVTQTLHLELVISVCHCIEGGEKVHQEAELLFEG